MRITNFGSCNVDNVYSVSSFARPGETLSCTRYDVYPGGKGLNQSLALAHAGASVRHAGKIGQDGLWMKELLATAGVDTAALIVSDTPSGHAVIQVDPEGENSIVIYGGANREISETDVDAVLQHCEAGEFLLLQNEISSLDRIIRKAAQRDLRVVFNAAPMTEEIVGYPLGGVEIFIVNESEGAVLVGSDEPDAILDAFLARYPGSSIVLTLGKEGAIYADIDQRIRQRAAEATAVDTTGAGDTFIGYFLTAFSEGKTPEESLSIACRAAAICIGRPGAASSIPTRAEVDQANSFSR